MAKRARTEEEVIEPPSDIVEHSSEVQSEEKPEPRPEGSREKLTAIAAVGEFIQEEGVTVPVQVAATTLEEEEELDDGSFWSLLIRAGYTVW